MRTMTIRSGLVPLSLTLCVLALSAVPLQAQLGGLMRRTVERRVGQKVDDQANIAMLIDPQFDQTTLELTPARLDSYTAAMEKRKETAKADRAKAEAIRERASALRDSAEKVRRPKEEQAYDDATRRYDDCRQQVRQALDDASEARTQAFVAQFQANPMAAQKDPKTKEMMAVVQQMGAAQQKGDAAEVQRLTARFQSLFGQVTDSAAIDKAAVTKCGARPTKPASMVQAQAFNRRADAAQKEAESLEGANSGVSGAMVGMTDVQSQMIWERIESWLSGMRKDAPITVTFTRAEYDQLVERRSQLRKAFNGS